MGEVTELKTISQSSAAGAKPMTGSAVSTDAGVEVFDADWNRAREAGLREHKVYDYAYLAYKSVLAANYVYGADYVKAFGYNVFDPLTYQSVEAIKAQLNARRVEFAAKSQGKMTEENEKYVSRLDNIEWERSGAQHARAEVVWYCLVTGLGYYGNFFVDDRVTRHFPVMKAAEDQKPQDPEDGEPQLDKEAPTRKLTWEPKEIVRYQGMVPKALSPWYCFKRPGSTSRKDWGHFYTYTIWTVAALREFVVSKGWLTEDQAKKKIVAGAVQRFDAVRDTIDTIFEARVGEYFRGDHQAGSVVAAVRTNSTSDKDLDSVGVIERFEEDYYGMKLDGGTEILYQDFNVYPHKEIPIIEAYCNKIAGEDRGYGIPEQVRHQQIETNRIHNYTLNGLLMTIVQRYAVNGGLLEDDSASNFENPFRPIRLKRGLPGVTIQQAVMAMPQPDIKRSPFDLMELVKRSVQQTTGASDFVVSANKSEAGTATESNNMASATNSRVAEYARSIDEEALPLVVKQWHACYPVLYDQDLEFRLTGEKLFTKFIASNRSDVNEDQKAIEKAEKALNVAAGSKTLRDVYIKAGYDMVIFLDDLTGDFEPQAILTDTDADRERTIVNFLRVIKVMSDVNQTAANTGDARRFDIFDVAKEMLKNFPQLKDVEKYITGGDKPAIEQKATPEVATPSLPFPNHPSAPAAVPPAATAPAPAVIQA